MPADRTAPRHVFRDRRDAGRRLGVRLAPLAAPDVVVLGLPRGGVPVAFEVAAALGAPLDVLVARKIGAPGDPELGMGAVAEGGVTALNPEVLASGRAGGQPLQRAIAQAEAELAARAARLRGNRPPLDVHGRTVIVVDDGLATGGTARAAAQAIRLRRPQRLVLAVPVGAAEALAALAADFDEIVCLQPADPLWAIGYWYEDFGQVGDDEVAGLLERAGAQAYGGP